LHDPTGQNKTKINGDPLKNPEESDSGKHPENIGSSEQHVEAKQNVTV
jgi:hypothetical protein